MAVAAVVIALVAISTATITIIGGGLAGCEAAYQLAERGHPVRLIEMKPHRRTPAQTSDKLAELGVKTADGSGGTSGRCPPTRSP